MANKLKNVDVKVDLDLEEEKDELKLDEKEKKLVEDTASEYKTLEGFWACKLKKPIMYDEVEYETLTFDFENLTGADALSIENELAATGKPVFMNEVANVQYLMRMAVLACREPIGVEAFTQMGIADFNRIKNKARLFLLGIAL